MDNTLIRGRQIATRPLGSGAWELIEDGAIYQEAGVIQQLGKFADLQARYPDAKVIGDGTHIILPGFVNAHHHVGLTPLQLGAPDHPNEFWGVSRLVSRAVDPYLDTLYSAFELIASGVTTVQHIRGLQFGTQKDLEQDGDTIIRAYEDIGMRVSYSINVRDQNRFVQEDDKHFCASLPDDVRPLMEWYFSRCTLTLEDYFAAFETLYERHNDKPRVKVQLAPANLHWCSDAALTRFARRSEELDVPMHMHLLETPYQREYAYRRGSLSAVAYIDRFGLLGKRMTLGHAVWCSDADIDRIADTGTHICNNCSSNFRLKNGIAPLNRFESKGINSAIGIDEAGLNDDRDMLQEMRLVLRAHRTPSPDRFDAPTVAQVLRMATAGGAQTTPFAAHIGTLELGRQADLVMIDWEAVSYPFLDPLTSVVDAVVQRAKVSAVTRVLVQGEVIYENGIFARLNRDDILSRIHDDMKRPLSADETRKRELSRLILPHVEAFYEGYVRWPDFAPHYTPNSRV